MRQVLLRHESTIGTGGKLLALDCRMTGTAGSDGFVEIMWPLAGTFRHLVAILDTPPGDGKSRTLALRKNGVTTALSLTISDTNVLTRNSGDAVTVVPGDRVQMIELDSGSPATTSITWTIEFDSNTTTESAYGTNIGITQTGFVDPLTGRASATADDCKRLIPCDGTITSLMGGNTFGSVSIGNELNFFLYLNGVKQDGAGGTVDTQLSVTSVAADTALSSSFTLPVVRGDSIYIGIEEVGTYPTGWTSIACVFDADVAGQSIFSALSGGDPSATVVEYHTVHSTGVGGGGWLATADSVAQLRCGVSSVTLHSLILEASTSPGAGNTRTFEVLKNGAVPSPNAGGVVTSGTLIIDDTGSITFDDGDVVGPMEHTPFSTPTVTGRDWWSLIMGASTPETEEPEPPDPGGEAPEGGAPLSDSVPVGITRLFARLSYGIGSPQTEIKLTETPFFFDPPEWYGGYGNPWLISVSTINRRLTDSLQGAEISVRLADPDRFFRTLAMTTPIAGATLELFLVSDTTRYALGVPHRRFAGIVHDHRALDGMEYELIVRDVLSEEMARLSDAPVIPPARLTATQFPGMTPDFEGRAVPIALGEVSDETAITPQGVVPPMIVAPSLNLATAFGGINVEVVAAVLSHGVLPPATFWQGYFNTVADPYTRIPIPFSAWGTIMTAPGMPGWAYTGVATDYIDYPSDPALTHRYTPIFFLASDPNVQAVLDGRMLVAFNVYGLTDEPDGSGLYFADAPDIYEFLLRNYLYPPHWRYGPYNELPQIAGYAILDHARMVIARNRLRTFGGGSYPVGFLLGRRGQQQTLRHVLQELSFGVLMEQGIDRHGRIVLDVEDVDAEATLNLSDILDIENGEFEAWIDRSAYRNNAEYFFGFRYLPAVAPLPTPPEGETLPAVNLGAHQDWQSIGTALHSDAITANNGRETPAMQLENYVIRNSDTAAEWVTRILERAAGPSPAYDGPRMFRIRTSWQALDVELGDVIAIDHIDGFGTEGFEGQRGRILSITDDLQNARITLEGRLLYGTGGGGS